MDQVWAFPRLCGQWLAGFAQMTLPEWAGSGMAGVGLLTHRCEYRLEQ